MSRKRRRKQSKVEHNVLEQLNLNAAGIDLGTSEIYVCVPAERDEQPVRCFGTFTDELEAIADWLAACEIETVAMESTGVYWVPLYDILEQRGYELYLVNARHLKNVSGRKSDVADCQWLQQLHTYGLLQASFRPAAQIRAIRSLVRHRKMLVRYRSAHIQHMQKALDQMNLKLTNVLSDITGVTGMKIIGAIVAGERDPVVLARFRDPKCAKSESEIARALTGNYQREYLFELKQALELYRVYAEQIRACDAELERLYQDQPPASGPGTTPPEPRRGQRRKNQAHFDLASALYQMTGVDLTAIDGIDALTAQVVLSEVGTDMNKWPTSKHFASWLGLCPDNQITGGKVRHRQRKKTNNRANTALRIAAQTLSHSQSALGAFYRRLRAKHGPAKANVAAAHKLARIIYQMLKNKVAYVDPGLVKYEQQHRDRLLRTLQRKAERLGMKLEPIPPLPLPTEP